MLSLRALTASVDAFISHEPSLNTADLDKFWTPKSAAIVPKTAPSLEIESLYRQAAEFGLHIPNAESSTVVEGSSAEAESSEILDIAAEDIEQRGIRQRSWKKYREWLNDQGFSPQYESRRLQQKFRQDFETSSSSKKLLGTDSSTPEYPGHPLVDPSSGHQVGYWSPDLPGDGQQVDKSITCLAISQHDKLVYCLALQPTDTDSGQYKRVGLAFWQASAWEKAMKEERTLDIV
jgi:hypothetical protein